MFKIKICLEKTKSEVKIEYVLFKDLIALMHHIHI